MGSLKRFSFVLSLCLAASIAVWGQSSTPGAQYVYVATGGPQIYAVSTGTATTSNALIPSGYYNSSNEFDSLAIGPDNTSDNDSGGNYFFLYACDSTNGSIVRLQLSSDSPGSAANAVDLVDTVPGAVCGRVDSEGDLYVSSATSGSGVWVIQGASTTDVGGSFQAASQAFDSLTGSSFTGGGIAQKNVGDMLVVDSAKNKILKSSFVGAASPSSAAPFSPTLSDYVTSGLDSPGGIARISNGDFFVVNQGSDSVVKFDPTDLPNFSTCFSGSKNNVSLTSVAASEDNYIYVGINSSSQNSWAVQILDGSCGAEGSIALSNKLLPSGPVAVAVPPVSAGANSSSHTTDSFGNVTYTFNFGSSLYQGTTVGGCTLTVTQTPVARSFLQPLTTSATPQDPTYDDWNGGAPAQPSGEGGFVTVYHATADPLDCAAPQDVSMNLLIDQFFDTTTVTNPRIIHCQEGFQGCEVADAYGNWPTSGYLPEDQTSGGKIPAFGSYFFLANGNLTNTPGELGTFCGFQSPLLDGATQLTAPVFNSGQGLSVKFKLGAYGSCSSGSYVTDATVLLSVAQIVDENGNPTFAPITINTQGNSTDTPPLFKFNSNSQNYQFSLSLQGYAVGTYALTVTFLTNNAPAQTTYFKVQ